MKKKVLTLIAMLVALTAGAADYASYYDNLPIEVQKASPVIIQDKRVNVQEGGAVGDGYMDCTYAIQRAIDQVAESGGGHVIIPAGVWITAPLRLKAGVDLHLEKNCILQLTPDRTRHIDSNTSKPVPGIYAENCLNVSITGEGTIDGNGDMWRAMKRVNASKQEMDRITRLGGTFSAKGDIWYPYNIRNFENIGGNMEFVDKYRSHLIRFNKCGKILIQGVKIVNSPKFHIALADCEDVVVDGTNIQSPCNASQTIGVDVNCCQRVLLVNNVLACGDVAFDLKAGTAKTAASHKPCEDIVIANNQVDYSTGGFVIGTEFAAGVNRVVVHDNTFAKTNVGLRFKSSVGRGGKTSQIYCYNIYMTDIKEEAILLEAEYFNFAGSEVAGTAQGKEWSPEFRDIHINNVVCSSCRKGIRAEGVAGSVRDVEIANTSLFCQNTTSEIASECRVNLKNVKFNTFKK